MFKKKQLQLWLQERYVLDFIDLLCHFNIHSFILCSAFEDYKQILFERYPDIIVNGENYQPSGIKIYLAQFLSIGKIVFIAMVLLNSWPTFLDQFVSASIKQWIFNHKLYACLMSFFLCNTIENSLLSTGAFEIEYNDILIWSKIKNGRILAPTELFSIIDGFSRGYVGDLNDRTFINSN